MIFLLAGTKDGRELAEKIAEKNYRLIISVVSEYGKNLIESNKNIAINQKPMNLSELTAYLKEKKIKILIDASHPYATNASHNAIMAAQELNIKYIRFEREKSVIDYKNIHLVKDNDEAVKLAANMGKNIFFTTGSRTAKYFFEAQLLKNHRLIFRVLPVGKVLSELNSIGILPDDIVALKGPFSKELNKELFRTYNADAIVTKDSGNIGGVDTKIEAAKDLNLPVIIIERPKLNYTNIAYNYNEIFEFISSNID